MSSFRLRQSRICKVALLSCFVFLLWLGYNSLSPVEIQEARVLLERERKRCLFRQGADPGGYLAGSSAHSEFQCAPGRYPSGLCTVNLLYLNRSERRFVARAKEQYASRLDSELRTLRWPIVARSHPWPNCTEHLDEAFIFTVEDSPGDNEYFKLHMSTFIPLFSLMAYREHLGPPTKPGYSVAIMPAVEDYSLQMVDWEAGAFLARHRFGIMQQMLAVFAGHATVMPLVVHVGHPPDNTVTCIRVAHFGVGSINSSNLELLQSFSTFMRAQLGLPLPYPQPTEPLVCLAKRSFSRRILNEDGLISAVSKFVRVRVVQFDAISYAEQVAEMQQFTILVGFHGGELLNSLYMPVGAVTIQLVPYNAKSLDTEKYAQVLRAHGPYLEWHNQQEKNSRPNQVDDSDNRLADTLVPVEEFVLLVKQALNLGINSRLVQFQSP